MLGNRKVIVSFLLIVVILLSAAPALADGPINYSGFYSPEQEYYRAAFDVCVWAVIRSGRGSQGDAVPGCNEITRQFREDDWYNQPSPGFDWNQVEPAKPERTAPGWGSEI